MFTGFLTAGSFLLSMKLFLITTMKKEYYDQPFYTKILADYKKYKPSEKKYDRLNNFRWLLMMSIWMCYMTTFCQIMPGAFVVPSEVQNGVKVCGSPSTIIALLCILMGLTSLIFVMRCLRVLSRNLKSYLEEQNKDT